MISVIIPAAGSGTRMEQDLPKALTPFADTNFLELQIRKFAQFADQILVVISSDHLEDFRNFRIHSGLDFEIMIQVEGKGTYFAIKSAISNVKHNIVVIAWADQIGISSSLISRVCSRILFGDSSAVVPLFFKQNPYVRALLTESREIIGWEYQREGDTISEGFTDLGIFAFSTNDLRRGLDECDEQELRLTSITKEVSFLDFISTFGLTHKITILETFDKFNAIGVNNRADLMFAKESLKQRRMSLKFSVIIPSYNEAPRLPALLDSLNILNNIYEYLEDLELEVIVVDDGSEDDTRLLVLESNFSYLFQKNQGKGSAVKNGVMNSTGDYVLVLDADGEYLVDDINTLIETVVKKPNAVVFGSRYLNNSNLGLRLVPIPNQSWLNLYFNYLLSFIIKIRFGIFISDSLTGFKVYPRELYLAANPETKGFETDHELTRKIIFWKFPIIEVPVSYFPRKKSEGKKITFRDAFKALGIWLK
jgi:bifunctional N-acetylglucosamine-1-phosphate-uridyltransferase/glucosamine-1-phosphate-acetyltransferase GlmU-like protein